MGEWAFGGGVGWMMRASVVVVGVFFGGEVGGKVYFFEKKCVLVLTCFVGWCNLVLHSPCRR